MRLGIDARARNLLRRLPVSTPYTILELLLIGVLAVQGARLVWTILTPVGPVGRWQTVLPGAGGSPVDMLRSFDPFFRLEATASNAAPSVVTPLQLTLFGTRIDDATGRGGAIIATPDGVQGSYAVGAEVMPGVILKQVAFDHVTLTRGGVDEDLFIDQSGSAPPPPGGPEATVGSGIAAGPASAGPQPGQGVTLTQLRSDIGFIPRIDNGRVSGLVVRPLGTGAVFKRVGLKEGDIVTQISGRPVSGQGDIDGLAARFAGGGNISLAVERGAEILPVVVTVTGQ